MKEIELWPNEFYGRLKIQKKFIEVRPDPFSPSDVKDLYVLMISVCPSDDDRFFSLKVKASGGMLKHETYVLNEKDQATLVQGR